MCAAWLVRWAPAPSSNCPPDRSQAAGRDQKLRFRGRHYCGGPRWASGGNTAAGPCPFRVRHAPRHHHFATVLEKVPLAPLSPKGPPCLDVRPPQSGAHQYTACNVQPATVNKNPYPPVPTQHICPHLHTQACEDSRHAEGTARHTSRATRTTSQKTSENSPELTKTGPSRHCKTPRPGSYAGSLLDATRRG